MSFSQKKETRYNPDSYSPNILAHAGRIHVTMPAPKCPPCRHGNFHHFDSGATVCRVCGWEKPGAHPEGKGS